MSRLEEEYNVRRTKRDALIKASVNPYPARSNRTHSAVSVLANFDSLAKKESKVTLTGRIKTLRLHGGSSFAHVDDGTDTIQIFVRKDGLGDEQYQQFKTTTDIGDFIQITGTAFRTKKGEKTILVASYVMLAKSLLPLPEKWHGLSDIEIRFRKRYLDLITNESVKEIFRKRTKLVSTIRQVLDTADFMEVETPMLQPIPGGANAEPFVTHHNALDTDLYLRIAPELYLKRLIVGGFDRVYEIARCFRNEGIDRDHNPEFTQVEMYAAYWDYEKMMSFTEELFEKVVLALHDTMTITHEGRDVTFTLPFKRITFQQAVMDFANIDIDSLDDAALLKAARDKKIDIASNAHRGKILDELFKELVRPKLIQPTFVIDYPIELSPLAKKKEDNPKYVERFQLVAAGIELCNAFSELNDPIDQRARFEAQEDNRKKGDAEAQRVDEDYIEALSHGMPPTAGIGIGIDRLAALLTDTHNIKEVILFPTLKPRTSTDENKR